MRTLSVCLLVTFCSSPLWAAKHANWDAYMQKNRYKCPGPFDSLSEVRKFKIGGKSYAHDGYRLEIQSKDADKSVKVGIISALKDSSSATKKNLKDTLAWFKKEKAEWIIANGDLAMDEFALEEVMEALGKAKVPVLIVVGNSESRGSWARTYKDRAKKYPNLINGTWVRQIVADDVEFWTLPGYYDKAFVHQGAGCGYKKEDLDAMKKSLNPAGSSPVVLISHGPPRGKGKHAIDWILDKRNVGDPMINDFLSKKKIAFGVFGHILEAGGAGVGTDQKTRIAPGKMSKALYLNAGSLSGDPWRMNDNSTSNGMSMLLTIEGKQAKYSVKKFSNRVQD